MVHLKNVCKVAFLLLVIQEKTHCNEEFCSADSKSEPKNSCAEELNTEKYKDVGQESRWSKYKKEIKKSLSTYTPCSADKCTCHHQLIKDDLRPFQSGISSKEIQDSMNRGTLYQIIDHKLYRQKECMFPSRCSGVEYFILKILPKLPNMEFVLNTRDWPQVSKYGRILPVFSFSKTKDYIDITYPAWTFWEGGPAISIYPKGLGRWKEHRKSLMVEAERISWHQKKNVAFFRGSRTSSERDSIVRLSRENPDLVDAAYTKNQAWKSDADTLNAAPAAEVSLEKHCAYKYLFNYRGVAASFRLKHLFLCKSLVFHVGHDWMEFFYPQLKPWVHYIPVPAAASKEQIRDLILFARSNDKVSEEIAFRGFVYIRDHLRIKDVLCYWNKLLKFYSKLLDYEVVLRKDVFRIHSQQKMEL